MPARNRRAALTLFLFPAVSVELLGGNTSLAQFFDPPTFVVLTVLYGGAALLVRETVVRWGKGFTSIVVLASGYGMVNEGLCSKGFFDPHFYAVVATGLEGFGRWFGINVPWALYISIFHATFSIIVPIGIASSIFPGRERWIGSRLYAALLVALGATIVFSFALLRSASTHYRYGDGPGPIALILSLLLLDIVIAWKLPAPGFRRWQMTPHAPALFALGAVYAFAFFLSLRILQAAGSPLFFVAFYAALFVALPVWLLLKLPEVSPRGKVMLIAGLLVPMLTVGRGAWPGGIAAAGIVVALLVIAFVRAGRPPSV